MDKLLNPAATYRNGRNGKKSRPSVRRWTREEFYRLLDEGHFNGERVELIEGEIIDMSAQKNWHVLGIDLADDALNHAFGRRYWVRVQATLDLTPFSAPDPDIAVISGSPRDNAGPDNPTTALLIVEVSESSLLYDRKVKGSLYARVAIEDYWILNLIDRQLEVYRRPAPDPKAKYGFSYQDVTILGAKDGIAPLAKPKARIRVADLLP